MKPPANPASKPYILIVEDDSTTLSVYKNILENIGGKFYLKCFSDARDALYFLQEKLKTGDSILAILLDLHMPYLDGWQFLDIINQLKEFSLSPPLIWLCSADSSSYTFKQVLQQAFVDRFIQKPIEWNQLVEFYEKVSEFKPKPLNGLSHYQIQDSYGILTSLLKKFPSYSPMSKTKRKHTEQVILGVRSRLELEEQVSLCLNKYDDPIYQSLILLEFFYTLEEFIIKVKGSDEPKKNALIKVLRDYLETIDSLWHRRKLHLDSKSKSHFDRYCSEYKLLDFRYLSDI